MFKIRFWGYVGQTVMRYVGLNLTCQDIQWKKIKW